MKGSLELLLDNTDKLIGQNEQLLQKLNEQNSKDTSWIDVPFILQDLRISRDGFHQYWKKRMPFLRRAKGVGSNYRAVKWEYEEWKEKYWESLKTDFNND